MKSFRLETRRACSWTTLPVPSGKLAAPLNGLVTFHDGRIPRLFLPSTGVDLVLAAGAPLPAPWGLAGLLIHVERETVTRLPDVTTTAFRIPLQPAVLRALTGEDAYRSDGLHAAPHRLIDVLKAARLDRFRYSPEKTLEIVREAARSAQTLLRQRIIDIQELVSFTRSPKNCTSVAAWSRGAGVSTRSLERTLLSGGSVTPKRFLRVARLNTAALALRTSTSLIDVAGACGFFDQSHMSREVRLLTGLTAAELKYRTGSGDIYIHELWTAASEE